MTMDVSELEGVGFAAGMTDAERELMASLFTVEEHPVGTALIVEGGDPTKFFVLLDGNVTVHREGAHVVDLGAGECFGEVGVVELATRNATVISTTPIKVAAAMGWDLRSALESNAELAARISGAAARGD